MAGIAGDQQAALFGQACFDEGTSKCTYGTGSFVLVNTGKSPVRSDAGLLTTVAWDLGDGLVYALEGAVFVTGAAVQWLRDGLGIIGSAPEIEGLAGLVPDTGGVVFVPALTGLGAPDWDPDARGTIIGITRGTTRAHLARATLEAIAFEVRDVVDAMVRPGAGARTIEELSVDGGASGNGLLCQLQADQLAVPVRRPQITETTGLGAAFLAGLGTGVWSSTRNLPPPGGSIAGSNRWPGPGTTAGTSAGGTRSAAPPAGPPSDERQQAGARADGDDRRRGSGWSLPTIHPEPRRRTPVGGGRAVRDLPAGLPVPPGTARSGGDPAGFAPQRRRPRPASSGGSTVRCLPSDTPTVRGATEHGIMWGTAGERKR